MTEHCLFCGGALDGNASCEICRVRRVVKDEKRIGAPCPRCGVARLGPFGIGQVVVQGCVRCRGMFVTPSEWDAVLELLPVPDEIVLGRVGALSQAEKSSGDPYRSAARDELEVPAAPDKPDVAPLVSCPMCGKTMERLEFAGRSRIDVDVCARHGIWLDAGELAVVVARARNGALEAEEAAFVEASKESHPSFFRVVLEEFLRQNSK